VSIGTFRVIQRDRNGHRDGWLREERRRADRSRPGSFLIILFLAL
jgi:hypothetical protein